MDGIDEPVIYNYSHPVDVLGNPIKNAQSNLFFNSLTHDTVIVQIPRLRKNVKSRVEEFLEIFDQSRTMPGNTHYLLLDNEENKPFSSKCFYCGNETLDNPYKKFDDLDPYNPSYVEPAQEISEPVTEEDAEQQEIQEAQDVISQSFEPYDVSKDLNFDDENV